ncbi:MAG TPA: C45 family peptidase [Chloroflexota bacterium]|nr:C45 family peptidase [Chloroflexota bacterium]
MNAIREIELKGEPGERGYQHGRALRDDIGVFYERFIAYAVDGAAGKHAESDYLNYAMAHLPAARQYAPDLVEEVEGIAQGAGIAFEKAFVLNCFDEVNCHGPALLKGGLHGCTAFAATGRATRDGTTYIGQGWDMNDWYPPVIFRLVQPDGETEALVYGHPGIIGGTGINRHGLALVWNTLKSNDARPGVPAPFVVRKALQQQYLPALVGIVIGAHRANGLNFIVGASFGAVDIEVSATKYAVTYGGTFLHHANHHEAPQLLQYEDGFASLWPDTLIRSGRMRQLLEEHFGRIDLETCQEIMRDHGGYPGSICRHLCDGQPGGEGQTQASLLYVPAEGKMLATNGRACEQPFVEYTLSPVREAALA